MFLSCKWGRYIAYNVPDLHDYQYYPHNEIKNAKPVFDYYQSDTNIELKGLGKKPKENLERLLETNNTLAFLIIHKDTIKYERYFRNYDKSDKIPSFSMAKSILSILIGCAIEEGKINSVDEAVTQYLPELSIKGYDKITIRDLLQMTSGTKYNENYFIPTSRAADLYYGTNIRKAALKITLKSEEEPEFNYSSGDSQLLGLILDKALKDTSISTYLEAKIWEPLGMEYSASWNIDSEKERMEKTYCCINSNARDFSKIGRLYLNKGNWEGKQIVSEKWVSESTKIDTLNGSAKDFQYHWWIPNEAGDFAAMGYKGQIIFVSPTKELIIVRLGKNEGKIDWLELFERIKEKIE